MTQPPAERSGQPPNQMSPDLIEIFLKNQTKELELRSQELVLQQQKDKNNFDYAKSGMAVTAQDRKDNREHQFKVRKMTFVFTGIICLAIIGMLVYALNQNKDAFALEIIKAIVFVLTGGAGGYGLAKSQTNKETAKSTPDERV